MNRTILSLRRRAGISPAPASASAPASRRCWTPSWPGPVAKRIRRRGRPATGRPSPAPSRHGVAAPDALGVADAHPRMSPEGKAEWLRTAAAAGRKPLMVGDGLNDTGGLAVAHASIAPSSGLDAARNAADLVLLSDRLMPVADALGAARTARTRMKQNIALAVAYNIVSVPIAMAGLATPLIAAIAMSTSSLTVTANAARGRT